MCINKAKGGPTAPVNMTITGASRYKQMRMGTEKQTLPKCGPNTAHRNVLFLDPAHAAVCPQQLDKVPGFHGLLTLL